MRRPTPRLIHKRHRAGEPVRGQATVEFAFVSIFLLFPMMLGIFEGARLVSTYFALSNAAREASRAGEYRPSTNFTITMIDANVRAAAKQTLEPWAVVDDGNITVCRHKSALAAVVATCDTVVDSGSVIDVTVTSNFVFVPYVGGLLGQVGIPLSGYHRARID
jgi:Flp pilus assembly protein TadG